MEIQKALYLAGAALTLAGCTPEKRPLPTPTPIVAPAFQSQEIDQYYSALSGIRPLGQGSFDTEFTQTTWFNFSNRKFDPIAAKDALEYFEKFARQSQSTQYRLGDADMFFSIEPRAKTNRIIFITAENQPKPAWSSFPVATKLYFDNQEENIPLLTLITTTDRGRTTPGTRFPTAASLNTHSFLVEACQSSVHVKSANPNLLAFGQEIICNSFGLTMSVRFQGANFTELQNWSHAVTLKDPSNNMPVPMYNFSEAQYLQMPQLKSIIF
jgi:hypothetical protein